jgi:hypothetical protein
MAKIPPLQRLQAQDFPKQSDWIDKLLSPINSFFEKTVTNLNKNLTIADNFLGDFKTVELDGVWPVKLAWGLSARPISVLVGNVYRSDGNSFTLSTAVQVQWQFNQSGDLQIDGITGITPSSTTKYKVVLECKCG